MKTTILASTLALTSGMSLAPGCNYSERDLDPTLNSFFVEGGTDAPRAGVLADAQAASGARAEGMLYEQHFDGPRLSSLGEHKLALMLADDDGVDPMVVYVDLGDNDARAAHRRDAVTLFLKERGLRDDQMMVVTGDNPAARSPAAEQLKRRPRTESGDAISGEAGGDVVGSNKDSAGGFYSPTSEGGSFGGSKR
jgi:hypothetical protein